MSTRLVGHEKKTYAEAGYTDVPLDLATTCCVNIWTKGKKLDTYISKMNMMPTPNARMLITTKLAC